MKLTLPTWRDHGIGFLLALVNGWLLFATLPEIGVPRDESFYLDAADRAADWVEMLLDPNVAAFERKAIDHGFRYNHEHPVLMKLLFGVSHRWLHTKWGLIDQHLDAYRLPTVVMASLAVWLTWLLGCMIRGRAVGLVAAVSLAAMPRVFFHSHLACFDAPVMFMWLAVCYAFLRAMRHRGWAVVSGLTLGAGLATKLNVFFVPFVLLGVAAVDVLAWRRAHGRWRAPAGERGPLTYHGWTAVAMIVLAPLVFWLHWPWLFYDTFEHIKFYVSFHARHVNYPVHYLGRLYFDGPFPVHFPFVFSALTLPIGTLVLGAVGLAVLARRSVAEMRVKKDAADDDATTGSVPVAVLVMVNFLVPFLIIALPSTPIFGGTKHWMTAMPFLAVACGVGAERVARGLWPGLAEGRRRLAAALLGLVMLCPAVWATYRYGGHGPAYFNALAGGPPGAAELGMPRNFWGYSTVAILGAVNEQVDKRGLVFWHKATQGAISAYKRDGRLRRDVRYAGDWTAPYSNWAVYHDQREKLPEEVDIWRAYGTDWPVDGYFVDGVQIMAVYKRPGVP